MTAQTRLRGFLFRCDRGSGGRQIVVFYAASVAEAKRYFGAWAQERGYVVTHVPDKAVVA